MFKRNVLHKSPVSLNGLNGDDTIILLADVNKNLRVFFFPLRHSEWSYFSHNTYIFPYYTGSCASWCDPIHKAKENDLAWLDLRLSTGPPSLRARLQTAFDLSTLGCLSLSLFRPHISMTLAFCIWDGAVGDWEAREWDQARPSYFTDCKDPGFACIRSYVIYKLDYSIWFWYLFLGPYISHLPVSSRRFALITLMSERCRVYSIVSSVRFTYKSETCPLNSSKRLSKKNLFLTQK